MNPSLMVAHPQNQGEHGAEITGLGPIGGRR